MMALEAIPDQELQKFFNSGNIIGLSV